jgi:hypothetical protein
MGAYESGQAFLAGVLAKLPAEQQVQAKAIFEAAEARDALMTLGDGALARSDYSKQMDAMAAKEAELTAQFENLNSWYDVNKDALQDYRRIKSAPAPGNDPVHQPAQPAAQPPVDPRKVVEEVLNEAGRDYVQVSAWLADRAVEHYQTFGERLNTQELAADPRLGKPYPGVPGRIVSLPDVYQARYGERLAARHKEEQEKAFNAEVDKRLGEKLRSQTSQPFPLRESSPSVLDALATKDGPAAHTLDTAVAEYERLTQARGV